MRISDWSSDVCSSDLPAADLATQRKVPTRLIWISRLNASAGKCLIEPSSFDRLAVFIALPVPAQHTRIDSCRSEEHTSELQSLMRISYAVLCLKKKKKSHKKSDTHFITQQNLSSHNLQITTIRM